MKQQTKVLLFLIDAGDEDPAKTCVILEHELDEHSTELTKKPKFYALNKLDLPENQIRYDAIASSFENPFRISGVTGEGVPELLEQPF